MAGELPRAVGGGCLRGLLIQLLVMALALGLLVCCGGFAAVLPVDDDLRPLLGLLSLMAWVGCCMVGAMAFVVINRRRIARRVDGAFAPLGLRGEAQMTIGRQYHGDWGGRHLDAYFQKGPSIELILATRAGTRVAIAPGDALVRAVQGATGRDRFDPAWPELAGVSVSADEGPWARALLEDPLARQATADLLDPQGAPALRVLSVQPGAVQLTVRGSSLAIVDGDRVLRAAEALARFAERVEAAAPPAEWKEPSALASKLRARRPGPGFTLAIVLGTFAFVLVLSVAVAGAVLLLQPR